MLVDRAHPKLVESAERHLTERSFVRALGILRRSDYWDHINMDLGVSSGWLFRPPIRRTT